MTTLFIDSGNSRLKWAYRDRSGDVDQSEVSSSSPAIQPWGQIRPQRVVVAAVRRSELLLSLLDSPRLISRPQQWAKTRRKQAGVVCAYDDPSRLGVDRWLAVIAAHARWPGEACVVVDCGTAVTVDVLADNGQHLGGYIVPGRVLMADALARFTERVKVGVASRCSDTSPGTSTEEAVNHGLLSMLAGLVERSVDELAAAGSSPRVLVGGGGGSAVAEHLRCSSVIPADNLVLEGLKAAYPD